MKLLTLIVHTDAQQDVVEILRSLDQVSGYTFSRVEGHGEEAEQDAFLSARDNVVGVAPRIRVDIRLDDNDIDAVLAALSDRQNIKGQGVYWVTSIDQGGRLS